MALDFSFVCRRPGMAYRRIERRAADHAGGEKQCVKFGHGTAKGVELAIPVIRRAGVLHGLLTAGRGVTSV